MANKSLLFRFVKHTLIRNHSSSQSDGIKCYGFTYYPRFPKDQDPPYEPSKLFLVKRVKPVKGNPYWEQNIMKELGLDKKKNDIAIVKNIPEVNARLWKVKHLIRITPITFPNGLPEEGDYEGAWLKENGEFIVSPRLKIDQERVDALDNFKNNAAKMDGETLRKQLRLKWLNAYN